jgi:broad specificity phosphatase PhoE
MEILRESLGLSPVDCRTDERLIELSFGEWEGLTWREVRRLSPALAAERERDKWGFTPPGGESYGTLLTRVAPAFQSLDRPTVLVAHGGVARALLAGFAGVSTKEAPRVDIWQGRVLVFEGGRHRWE